MKAIGYLRVSTAEQADQGVSLAAQRAKICAWAELHDRELVAVREDAGVSGTRADTRPALQDALGEACRLKAALVVYSLSRLCRSTRDAIDIAERLRKCGADLVSLTEQLDTSTASGRLFYRLMSSLAEFEADLTSERTRAALQHLRRQGKRTSRYVPFGFDLAEDGTTLICNSVEHQIIGRMQQLRLSGRSLQDIARLLTSTGVATKRGGRWSAKTVRSILLREDRAA